MYLVEEQESDEGKIVEDAEFYVEDDKSGLESSGKEFKINLVDEDDAEAFCVGKESYL